jgi:chemotaxis protein methyltransferase CheR
MTGSPTADAFTVQLTAREFAWITDFLHRQTGIVLKPGKEAMVTGRLARRLKQHQLTSYAEYFQRLRDPADPEAQVAVDLLTTNETYFFREPDHFAFLREAMVCRPPSATPVRVWSAASSSGEEAYTTAMVLDDCLNGSRWEVIGTDISTRVVERAQRGLYPLDAAAKIPPPLLRKYCLRGRGDFEGCLAISPALVSNVRFQTANLIAELPSLGTFDVVFLRNVMIYFHLDTKRDLVAKVERLIRPGGYLFISHSETLNAIDTELTLVKPSVYRAGSPP